MLAQSKSFKLGESTDGSKFRSVAFS